MTCFDLLAVKSPTICYSWIFWGLTSLCRFVAFDLPECKLTSMLIFSELLKGPEGLPSRVGEAMKDTIVCKICGKRVSKMPSTWTLDDCSFYCPECWQAWDFQMWTDRIGMLELRLEPLTFITLFIVVRWRRCGFLVYMMRAYYRLMYCNRVIHLAKKDTPTPQSTGEIIRWIKNPTHRNVLYLGLWIVALNEYLMPDAVVHGHGDSVLIQE